jgi:hypothetical protein
MHVLKERAQKRGEEVAIGQRSNSPASGAALPLYVDLSSRQGDTVGHLEQTFEAES